MLPTEIVSDTGPLISLEQLPEGFSLLRDLFRKIYLPPEVLGEIQEGHPGENYLRDHGIEDRIVVVSPPLWDWPEADRLDAGERFAIALAIARGLPLLIEERLGRKLAQDAGVKIIGAVGLVLRGHRGKILSEETATVMLGQLYEANRIGKRLFRAAVEDLTSL